MKGDKNYCGLATLKNFCDRPKTSKTMDAANWVTATLLATVEGIGLLGNFAVLLVIASHKKFHILTGYFLLANLSISDFLSLCLVVPFRVVSLAEAGWVYSTTLCKTNAFLERALYINSILLLIAVSYDRYSAIVKSPLTYSRKITSQKKLCITLLLVWCFPCIIASGPFLGWGKYVYHPKLFACALGWENHIKQYHVHAIFFSVCLFGFPFLLMLWLNLKVFETASRFQRQQLVVINVHELQQKQLRAAISRLKEHKAAKDVAIILGVFFLCFIPFCVSTIYRQSLPRPTLPSFLLFCSNYLHFSSSMWNPIIYCCRKKEFRVAARQLLQRKLKSN